MISNALNKANILYKNFFKLKLKIHKVYNGFIKIKTERSEYYTNK